jgi:hypothetical protein
MVATAADDDAEGRGGVDSSVVGLTVVCDDRCCCFISTTTFTLKLGESICCAALRRLSKGSILYISLPLLARYYGVHLANALFLCAHTKTLKDTLQHIPLPEAILLCACLFVRSSQILGGFFSSCHVVGKEELLCRFAVNLSLQLPSATAKPWQLAWKLAGVSESACLQCGVRRPSLAAFAFLGSTTDISDGQMTSRIVFN